VFKLIVAAAALDEKKITPGTTYDCPGALQIGKRSFRCWDTHHLQDLNAAIADSCDVYFYHCGLLLGADALHDYALKFGLGRTTQENLPNEVAGFVPSPAWRKKTYMQGWHDGDTANFAIGQGDLLVTPMQMARLAAVFANGGYLVTPFVVKAIDGRDISSYQSKRVRIAISAKVIESVRQGMCSVVSAAHGTGNSLVGVPVPIAGKTGSAQVAKKIAHGWFIGFFPVAQPRFAICVFLEHGGGGVYACGVVRDIVTRMHEKGLLL